MASEVGQAYLSILPSARGFAANLQREVGSDMARAGKAAGADYGKAFGAGATSQAKSTDLARGLGTDAKKAGATAGQDFGKSFGAGAASRAKTADVTGGVGADARQAGGQAGEDYGKAFADEAESTAAKADISGGVGDKLKTGGAVAGAAAGVAVVAGVGEALERGSLDAKLAAQLGGGRRAKQATKVASSLFQQAWGESVGEVNDAVASVVTGIGGMRHASERELKGVTRSVLDIGTAFDQDASSITRAVDQLVRTDLAKGPREALDIITRGFQTGANEADDLLDTYSEYGTQFRKLGLSGEEATGLLSQGLRAGARDADIVADSFKEFSLRSVGALTELDSKGRPQITELGKAFEKLGVDVLNNKGEISEAGWAFQNDLAAGGDRARKALEQVLDRLRNINDPLARSRTAVALFGTQAEDMGDALYALDPSKAVDTLGKVGNAANRMGDDLNDNASARITEFKRTLQNDFVTFVGGKVIPVVDKAYDAFKSLPSPVRHVTEAITGIGAVGIGGVFLGSKFISAIGSARDVIGGLGRTSSTVSGQLSGIGSAATASRGRLGKFASFLGSGGVWGLAIAGGVAILGAFMKAHADAEAKVAGLTKTLNKQTGAVTRNTAQEVINAAQKEGLYARAAKAGVSADQLTRALLGEKDALAAVDKHLRGVVDANSHYVSTGMSAAHVTEGAGRDAFQLRLALDNQSGALASATEKWKQNREAQRLTRNVLNDTRDVWDSGTKAIRLNRDQITSLTGSLGVGERKQRNLNAALRDAQTEAREAGQKEALHEDQLRDVAKQEDLTREQTQALIRKYGEVPKKVETDAKFNHADAERDVNSFTKFFNTALGNIENEEIGVKLSASARSAVRGVQNIVGGTVGLFSGKARGGEIRGGIPGRDSVPSMLMPGEHVFTSDDVRKAGGQSAMYAIRKMIQRGEFAKKGDLQYFRRGGAVEIDTRLSEVGTMRAVGAVGSLYDQIATAMGEQLSKSVSDKITQALATGGGRPLGPGGTLSMGQILKGQQFAKSQAGLPYQWGGTGNPSWDCSGFVGGTLLAALGQNPRQRIGTTASMPWPGWSPGVGTFTAGTDPGSHMAGNIGGLGIESRGGDGVTLGTGITPLTSFSRLDHYDRGGVLKPGWTAAYNGTGRDEYVVKGEPSRPRRRGPLRMELDVGGGRVLTGIIRDEIDGADDFAARTERMG